MERHIEIVRMTSKGQLVIPQEIRQELRLQEGDRLMLFKENGTVVLRPVKLMSKNMDDELRELKLAEAGWANIEAGRYTKYNSTEDFLKDLAKW